MPQIKEKLVESTAHSQSLFDAPAFRLYLVVHIEVKTMCWGASSPHQHPSGIQACSVTATWIMYSFSFPQLCSTR